VWGNNRGRTYRQRAAHPQRPQLDLRLDFHHQPAHDLQPSCRPGALGRDDGQQLRSRFRSPPTRVSPTTCVSQFSRLQYPFFELMTATNPGRFEPPAQPPPTTTPIRSAQPEPGGPASHFMKFGAEGRRYNDNTNNPGFASGTYAFRRNWTQPAALQADAASGDELATFLLGYPTSGFVDRNIDPAFSNFYYVLYFNDDWKVNVPADPQLWVCAGTTRRRAERYDRRCAAWTSTPPVRSPPRCRPQSARRPIVVRKRRRPAPRRLRARPQ
jgi:hypothetical protein